jgi:hypothetical protein
MTEWPIIERQLLTSRLVRGLRDTTAFVQVGICLGFATCGKDAPLGPAPAKVKSITRVAPRAEILGENFIADEA